MIRLRGRRGSAPAEFVLVSGLLLLLFFGAVQVAVALHTRNLAQDAAVHGARQAALADRTPADGARRAQELLQGTLRGGLRPSVTADGAGPGETGIVTVRVRAAVPLLGVFPGPRLVSVQASATRSGP